MKAEFTRRNFLTSLSMLAAGGLLATPLKSFGLDRKLRVCLVGTGIRGIGFWGRRLVQEYSDILEFTGLCDVNPGRLTFALEYMGVDCPTYAIFEEMIHASRPDLVIVTTTDATHHEFIIKGLQMGCDVLTEKPLTTDEFKCQAILDAERASNRKLIMGFNYRWSPYMSKIRELLLDNTIGKITSVDFNWYLNTYHGASYFRRWHGLRQTGGSLWVHKATHHFDLLNWWLDSDPSEVFAYGALEHYGTNGPFRGDNCRTCPHKSECFYYWDITKEPHMMNLYVANEHHDGYIRDNCLYRKEVNIHDKMSAQIKYANDTVVNYSLTTYSPFEGWRIAFNGMDGRIEAWQDIPYNEAISVEQADLHELEMAQDGQKLAHSPVIVHQNRKDYEKRVVSYTRAGHGGGDQRLQDKIFKNPDDPDPMGCAAGIRDGAMSVLIGIAARKSIETGNPIRIAALTDLKPRPQRI